MVIFDGQIAVSHGGAEYVDTYGDVPAGLTWDEFAFGVYPGVDLWSPLGSVDCDVTVSGCYSPVVGKASFGFVAKYNKKTRTPEGNTEFVFKAGNLNFHSSDYEWLLVNKNDTRAQFKGTGTINNEGMYRFMLWADDGNPDDGDDTFRIKIWEENDSGEVVIYDNGSDQAITSGNIVVHVSKD